MIKFCKIFLLSSLFIVSLSLLNSGFSAESAQSFVTTEGTFVVGEVQERDGQSTLNALYFRQAISSLQTMFGGWALISATVPSLTVDLAPMFTGAKLKGIYVRNCQSGEWVNIAQTRYLPAAGKSISYADPAQQKFIYINRDETSNQNIYPGELIDPTYECDGVMAEIPSYGGRRSLLSSGRVDFAYLIELSK